MAGLRLLALGLFIVAVVVRSALLGGVAMMLGSATLITGVWSRSVRRGLQVRRIVPATLAFGETAQIEIVVANRGLLPVPWLQVEERVPPMLRLAAPPHLVLSLGAGATRSLQYTIRGAQRGWYRLGPLRLQTGDVFGFGNERMTIALNDLTVLPRIVPVTELALPAAQPFGPLPSARRRGEDPARPAGVRPYQASDGVRRIDWKASAHRNELMVRRADPAIAPETTFALAFRIADYPPRVLHDALERAVTAVASFGVALLGRKLPVGLVSNGFDPKHNVHEVVLGLGKGDGQRSEWLHILGRLAAGDGPAIFALLARQPLPWGGTLVLVLADFAAEDVPQVVQLVRRGQQIAFMLLEPTPTGLALAQRYGATYWTVDNRGVPLRQRGGG